MLPNCMKCLMILAHSWEYLLNSWVSTITESKIHLHLFCYQLQWVCRKVTISTNDGWEVASSMSMSFKPCFSDQSALKELTVKFGGEIAFISVCTLQTFLSPDRSCTHQILSCRFRSREAIDEVRCWWVEEKHAADWSLHDLDDIVTAGGAAAGADWIFHSGLKLLKDCSWCRMIVFFPLACKLL